MAKDKNAQSKMEIKTIIIFLSLGLVLFFVILRFILPFFIFMPQRHMLGSPAALNLPYEDISLTTSDNVNLHGWYIPHPEARATVLFFHGNAGNISHRLDSIKIFNDLGLSVFIISYRGYGLSGGNPSIEGTKQDALAAWRFLTEEKGILPEKIVVFGRSLGGAVAMELMLSANPGALILESTFSSLADMSPFPASIAPLLMGGNFWNSVETAQGLNVATLCIHSPDDEVVPFGQGRRLFEAVGAKMPGTEKTFLEIQGDHNGGFISSYGTYFAGLDLFLTNLFGK